MSWIPSHHIVENQLNILAPLIQPEDVADAKVRLWVAQDARESMRQKLREQGWSGEDYVLMHPGARWHFKCWEDGKNAAIVQLLLNSGQNVVLTASPDNVEQYMLQEIIGRLNIPEGGKIWMLSGCLSLRELAAAIEGAKLFIGVDSAPMHIAAALDKPQIAFVWGRHGWTNGVRIPSRRKSFMPAIMPSCPTPTASIPTIRPVC